MRQKIFSRKKQFFFGAMIFASFLLLAGFSSCQAAVTGTSTALSTVYANNKVKENFSFAALQIELSATANETLNSVTFTVATSTLATSTPLSPASFSWAKLFKDTNNTGIFDEGDECLATTTSVLMNASSTIDVASATTTPAHGLFFVVLHTASAPAFTDNNEPDTPGAISQQFKVILDAQGVVTSGAPPTINPTITSTFKADTHSQAPSASALTAFYQNGNYYLQEREGQTIGEQGTTTIYADQTTTTPLAVVPLGNAGHFLNSGIVSLGSQYYASVWLELVDILGHSTSTRVQYNLPAQPSVTSLKAFADRIIINSSKNLRGDQATLCSNYKVNGSTVNCAGPGYPFIDFFGNQVVIRDLSLSAGSSVSFEISGLIQDIETDQFPLSYSTTTLLVQSASVPSISSISPQATTTGGIITITGSNFGASAGQILFSGGFSSTTGPLPPVQGTASSWTNTSIVVTVPSGAQSGPLVIATADGIMSDISDKSFFDVLGNVYLKLYVNSTSTAIESSTNMRIFISSKSGERVYSAGDAYGATFDNSSYVYTIPGISSFGFVWAYDASGAYLPSPGTELQTNTSSTAPMPLIFPAATTRKVSGTVTLGTECSTEGQNRWVAVMAMPEGSQTQMGPGGVQPAFFQTNNSCVASYSVALPGNGTFRVEAHLPPSTSSVNLLSPSGQNVVITDSSQTATVNFTFTSAQRKIYGRIVDRNGDALDAAKYAELWVFAYQPKEGGKGTAAKPNDSGYFSLYVNEGVYKIGVSGPMMPFPLERDITVDSSATFATSSNIVAITMKLEPPTTYIEGYVRDGTGSGISSVDMYSWCEGGPGGGHAFTDSQGYYKMYVPVCSNYHVGGFSRNYGQLSEQSNVTVSQSSNPTVNFTINTSQLITVSGTVSKNGSALSNADVWITQNQFGSGLARTRTDSNGNYQLKLSAGQSNLYLHSAIPGQGEFYNQLLSSSALNTSTTQNITVNTATLEIRLAPGNTFESAFLGAHSSLGNAFTDQRVSTSSEYDTYIVEVPYSGSTLYTIDGGIAGFGPLPVSTTTVSGNTTTTINLSSISFYTVSGTVTADSGTSTDAFVWAGGAQGGGGTRVNSDGTFTMKLREGTYDIGVGKAGYTGSVLSNQNISTTTSALTLTLTKNNKIIAGTVQYNGTAVSNAKVWANNGSGGWAGAVSEADGSFVLSVSDGEWRIGAIADGYMLDTPLRVNASTTALTLNLSAVSFNSQRQQQAVKPNEGGVVQTDDAKIEIPSGALGSGSSDVSIKVQNTMNVPQATGAKVFSSKAKEISATYTSGDNDGQSISVLSQNINIEFVLTTSTLSEEGITDIDSAKKIKIGYFDETAGNWVQVTTAVTLDPATSTTFADLNSITLKGTTNHLSSYAPLYAEGGAPDTPTNLTATPGSQQVSLSWTASSGASYYNIYRQSGSLYPFLASTTATTYTDTGLINLTTYYYKVSAVSSGEQESAATDAVSATPVAPTGGGTGGAASSAGDTTAPVISQITVVPNDTSATISWQTNEASISWLLYGTSTAYGSEIKTATSVTSHSLVLSNLSASTTYHYQIKAQDSAGNISAYTDQTFTTLALGQQSATTTPATATSTPSVPSKPISSMSVEELKAEIARITNLIAQLQAEWAKMVSGVSDKITGCTIKSFARTLQLGSMGEDVKCLQIILNKDPQTQVAQKGVGSPGRETNYFGALTKAAVMKFQEKYAAQILTPWGLSKGNGLVGKTTRAKLNEILSR